MLTTAARVFGIAACILAIALSWPWWVCVAAGGITIWLFSIPDPPPRRLYICQRVCQRDLSHATDIPAGGHQVLLMTEREANQRNAALAANGLEERWQ
jgi:hypothetical protein